MKVYRPIFLFVFGVLLLAGDSWAKTFDLNSHYQRVYLTSYAEQWKDETGGKATLADARNATYSQLRSASYVNYGFNKHITNWYHFDIRLAEGAPENWIFKGSLSGMESTFYLVNQAGEVKQIPLWKTPYFRLQLQGGQQYQIYFKTSDYGWNVSWLELYSPDTFWEARGQSYIVMSLYYGALFIMVLFNLFLLLSIKDRVYLYYILSLISFGLFQYISVDFMGTWAVNSLELYAAFAYMSGLLVAISFTKFTQRILNTAETMPRWHRFLDVLLLGYTLFFVISPFIPIYWVNVLVAPTGFLMPFSLLMSGILSNRQSSQVSIYYLAAWGTYLVVILVYTMNVMGFDPLGLNPYTINPLMKLASMIEIILIGMALGERYNKLNNQLVKMKTEQAVVLEAKIAERTQELEKTNRTKDKFFSLISHDLRGPIGSLAVTYSQIITSPDLLTEELLDATKQSLNKTYQLLEELLAWSASQTGQMDIKPARFEVLQTVNSTMELFTHPAQQKEISLTHNIQAGLFIYADVAMIETVVRNLINNALKFTRKGGSITLKAEKRDGYVVITVQDTGIGITAENIKKLFHIDQRMHSSIGDTEGTGSGLGLILCREFVELNGGTIEVQSVHGKGSSFVFSLPLAFESGSTKQELVVPAATNLHAKDQFRRILVVEDDPLHIHTTGFSLEKIKAKVKFAVTGEESLEYIANETFDLVLMDIDLPKINGTEVAKILKKEDHSFKIFALSAYTGAEIKEKFGDIPFDGYLSKPLKISSLLSQLN